MRVPILLSLLGLFQLSFLQADKNLNRRTSISIDPVDWESLVYHGITNYSAGEHSTLYIEYTTEGSSSNDIKNAGDFSIWGMGWNLEGMFGNGTTVDQKRPTQLFNGDVRKVSAGYFHSLFLYADGSLWGTGSNSGGELGDGTKVNKTSPIKVVSGDVVDMVAGARHSAFIKEDGSLWAMGKNDYGQLGIGNNIDQSSPIKVIEKGVLFVDVGGFNTLFVKSDGSLWGMGENEDGQLGVVGPEAIDTPIKIVSEGVIAASFGWNYLAFIKNDNSLWVLGNNDWGQLGNGTNEPSSTPVMIEASGVTSVSAGGGHLLYIKEDGSLWGVGRNDGGRLGTGNEVHQKIPVEIFKSGLELKFTPFGSDLEYTSVISVSAGGSHSLFMKNDGSLWGMGSNWAGGLGQGESVSDVYEPVQILLSATTSYYYEVSVEHSVGGSVEGGGLISLNEDAKVTAVPAPGYKFDSWSGDLQSSQNPFTFRRYHDLKLRANFVEDISDDDGDGVSNHDEWVIYDTNASNSDTDGDGLSDKEEIDQGKNPNSPVEDGDVVEQAILVTPFVNGWFYEPKMGWLFTNNLAYPYIFDANNSSWMYFKSGSEIPKFWHYGKKEWVELR